MKKNLLLSLALVLLLTAKTFAQSDKKNVIKVNLFSPVVRTLSLFYERALSDKVSAQLGFSYTGASGSGVTYRGYGITPEVRFYLSPNKTAPAGFFVGPFVRYRSLQLTAGEFYDINGNIQTAKATWNQVGGGVVIGGHWIWNWFSLDLFAGPAYYSNSFTYQDGASSANFSLKGSGAFSFRSGVTIGVAF